LKNFDIDIDIDIDIMAFLDMFGVVRFDVDSRYVDSQHADLHVVELTKCQPSKMSTRQNVDPLFQPEFTPLGCLF
jgi:hypothetical protein